MAQAIISYSYYGLNGIGVYFTDFPPHTSDKVMDTVKLLYTSDKVMDTVIGEGIYLTDLPFHTSDEVLMWNNYGIYFFQI